ncbi:MAG TPA: hypothetical protein VN370_11260 [Desulfitobacteriaceae bacterium]|nr:hypothetical protein [Desulfitobacteriaceae bacterium]
MKKKLRIIIVWTIISLFIQFSIYGFTNYQVGKILNPVYEPITTDLQATIPGTNLENIQISYAKDYLAYKENGVFKVFNLKEQKVVFEKKPEANSEENMGVMGYQWLPDRDALIYLYSKKNPNPVTKITTTKTTSTNKTVTDTNKSTTSEDLNNKAAQTPSQQPKTEIRYNNPWLTELYTLELPSSDELTPPDNRPHDISLDSYPAGGVITQMAFSTFTNLIYITVKSGTNMTLFEIDVMKDVSKLNRSGEYISNMAISDQQGTLYIDSKIGTTRQIVAVKSFDRNVISQDPNDVILGDRNGKLYLGKVTINQLTKISTREDKTNFNEKVNPITIWEGSIPYEDAQVVIGSLGQVIVYNQQTVYIVNNGKVKEVNLQGKESYVSPDGAELIELTQQGDSTLAELRPLE